MLHVKIQLQKAGTLQLCWGQKLQTKLQPAETEPAALLEAFLKAQELNLSNIMVFTDALNIARS